MTPEELGARCHECPLCEISTPVPSIQPSLARSRAVALVGESPSEGEERQKHRLVGPSGNELTQALKAARYDRREALIVNVLACRPPEGKLQMFLRSIKRRNRARRREAKAALAAWRKDPSLPEPAPFVEIPSPVDCCRPRFEKEIEGYERFITMGGVATAAVTAFSDSVAKVRGTLIELDVPRRRVVPTLAIKNVLHSPKWQPVFRSDLRKAIDWFAGRVAWVPPRITYQPDPWTLLSFLSNRDIPYSCDLESDGRECLTARIRCLAIGTDTDVMVMGFLGKDGYRRFYTPEDERSIIEILCEFLADPTRMVMGHNFGYYDKILLQQQWGVTTRGIVDTMLLHRAAESEHPHRLAFVASMFATAPPWKTTREGKKLATEPETDEELQEYCANDTAITHRVFPPLIAAVQAREQQEVFGVDQRMQAVCADMHTVGMRVDEAKRHAQEMQLLQRRWSLLQDIRDLTENPTFNPASVNDVRHLLFARWKLVPELDVKLRFTEAGDPSTADHVLRALLFQRGIREERRHLLKLLRYYRKVQKVLGTYVTKLRTWDVEIESHLGWDDEEEWADRETRKKYGLVKRGIVNPKTSRMHPGYNAHVAVTGRLSSSSPINAQNFPKAMRAMVVASPGNVLVGADMDQLELRIAAALWGVDLYLRAFRDRKDPHSMTAFAIFGEAFCKAAGVDPLLFERPGILVGPSYADGKFIGTGDDMKMRNLSKGVQYASQYMGSVETVHGLIQKTEVPSKAGDGTTDLPYALMPLKRTRQMRGKWLEGASEFEAGWEREIAAVRRHGYGREVVHGRRRYFLDGENPNEIVNFPIQGAAAGLMNKAIIQLHEQIPLHKWGVGTGIINQCHDSIVVECPASEGPWVARKLEEALNQTHPALPGVEFTASAEIGQTWKEVG